MQNVGIRSNLEAFKAKFSNNDQYHLSGPHKKAIG